MLSKCLLEPRKEPRQYVSKLMGMESPDNRREADDSYRTGRRR